MARLMVAMCRARACCPSGVAGFQARVSENAAVSVCTALAPAKPGPAPAPPGPIKHNKGMEAAAAAPDSRLVAHLEGALLAFCRALERNPAYAGNDAMLSALAKVKEDILQFRDPNTGEMNGNAQLIPGWMPRPFDNIPVQKSVIEDWM